ncbi:molybdopterin-guanine dinucleotide biosynthesis protein B [Planomicrobium stackebrandtii]|uniref:Molybdopterin-guanine dinucleotide biosynthesis protein B n=1 Tax=Planomicrobium stackebrandtii TaxID=253160 RepID=A0ABU0GPV8_9BACL|nr:molybdopterin-guanine dinucleotide biosynthesis protein B [Planomicrobium stackebrandtii]MDQ0427396.1 molybdopterin-guanine dinucleotide biosynthesis protein B [Planomicrobium stackebrandtii]
MAAVRVLQVVGFKNSGKTTLMLDLLKQATQRGMAVSTVKHHGHGGALEMPSNETDSMRFFQKGASCSIVYGDGVVQIHQRKKQATLAELVAFASAENPELVLVEGFKEAHYEKIVLLRSAEDWLELQKLEHIALVIAPELLKLDNVPVILQNDSKKLYFWFTNWMDGDSNEGI